MYDVKRKQLSRKRMIPRPCGIQYHLTACLHLTVRERQFLSLGRVEGPSTSLCMSMWPSDTNHSHIQTGKMYPLYTELSLPTTHAHTHAHPLEYSRIMRWHFVLTQTHKSLRMMTDVCLCCSSCSDVCAAYCLTFVSLIGYPLSAVSAKIPHLNMVIQRYVQMLAS